MPQEIFIYINNLSKTMTGVEISALQRAFTLSHYGNYTIYIIVRAFNKNFVALSNLYSCKYGYNHNVKFINFYSDLLGLEEFEIGFNNAINFDNCIMVQVSDFHERYYKCNGNLSMYVVYEDVGGLEKKVNYINYFINGKKKRREYFNGTILFSEELDNQSKCIRENYYDKSGVIRIVKEFDGQLLRSITINNSKGNLIGFFSCENDLFSWWLEKFYLNEKSIVLIDGGPHHIQAFQKLKPKLSLISILHSNHIKPGQDFLTGDFNSIQRKKMLEKPDSVDACIILTEEQKDDIKARLVKCCPLFTIAHSCFNLVEKVDFNMRDLDRIIIISRLEKEKNLLDSIDIMKLVLSQMPNKQLFIFGSGSQQIEIQNYIYSNNLENNIFLMGYSNDISKELKKSSLFLMTSLYESFALTILESLSHGVPVLSYDFKYGPRTLINNKINGFIIENKNKEQAAQAIIEYFNDTSQLEVMMKNAYQSAQTYHPSRIVKKWTALFKTLNETVVFDE